ncbi:MAG TPA: neutral zinc metallopeptidase, partial [Thermoanaerobaculia bacterium]|nr:neutral zinc metallopeptidase [Thermoanaerobaculia bacterium]
ARILYAAWAMRWQGRQRSTRVEDRRGRGLSGGKVAGGGIGVLLAVLAISWLTGADPQEVANVVVPAARSGADAGPAPPPPADDEQAAFVSVVLADTEQTWGRLLPQEVGQPYREPSLVLFSDAVDSACGLGSAAMGPFYCPLDGKVYLDLTFFRELESRFGAPGDFARAYVVAHEVGHHVQNLLGISGQVQRQRQGLPQAQGNELSVRLELQADCLAGVWGHHAGTERDLLESGDVEEGLAAAAAIGDDRMQRQTRGTVVPESFTHGTSAQRARWLRRGLESGDPAACDTFAAGAL